MRFFWMACIAFFIAAENINAQNENLETDIAAQVLLDEIIVNNIYNDCKELKNTFVEYTFLDSSTLIAIHDSTLYRDGWDSLPQPVFWRQLMKLPPDTAIVSIAANRQILEGMYSAAYDTLDDDQKTVFKDGLCKKHALEDETKLYVTFGRSNFYKVNEVVHQIDSAIKFFKEEKVDPFYAQAILLIESPNRLEYSWAGAYGPFQLMKSIGLKYGLTINKETDERADLEKSAKVTARYFKEFCIPQIRGILKQKNIAFKEDDLWFRLLVLHVYHAGWGNVKGVLNTLNPTKGGQELITNIWQTTYGSFKNASQNYSQVALAAMMELDYLIFESTRKKQKDTLSIETTEILKSLEDNQEILILYNADQEARKSGNIDWKIVSKEDSLRRIRVRELLDSNLIRTSKDYHNAAMVFQHGKDSSDYGMAVKLMKKSIELDSTANKWLLAAATDRYLLSKGEPQIYGTQFHKMGDGPWELSEMDTTKISDEERLEYRVGTLSQIKKRVEIMNLKDLSELYEGGKSINKIIKFIKKERKRKGKSEYNLYENGINSFGYDLMGMGKLEDACKIFKLNTEIYPNEYNTFDSYGECLLKMGKKEEAIKAYKKSLELNHKNKNAEDVLSTIR